MEVEEAEVVVNRLSGTVPAQMLQEVGAVVLVVGLVLV